MSNDEATVKCGEGEEVTFQGFFTMKAGDFCGLNHRLNHTLPCCSCADAFSLRSWGVERAIAAGEELLHTYGDLSDAELLQTFGFVEVLGEEGNPHNTVHLPHTSVVDACAAMAAAVGDEATLQAAAKRMAVLRATGMIEGTGFALPAAEPLSLPLLTATQVLLMPEEDFVEYEKSAAESALGAKPADAEAAAADAPTEGEDAAEAAEPAEAGPLLLGRECLENADFRQAVCLALLRAVHARTKALPAAAEEPEKLEGGVQGPANSAWRRVCAARVCAGQRHGLEVLKGELMELLQEGSGESGSEQNSDSEGMSDDEEEEEDEGEEEGSSDGSSGEGGTSGCESEEEQQPVRPSKRRRG